MSTILSRRTFLAAAGTAGAAAALPVNMASAQTAQDSTNTAIDSGPLGDVSSGKDYVQPKGDQSLVIGSLDDLEKKAADVILAGAFAYIASGADRQVTLRANRKAFNTRWWLGCCWRCRIL